jgi:hypothetical protein
MSRLMLTVRRTKKIVCGTNMTKIRNKNKIKAIGNKKLVPKTIVTKRSNKNQIRAAGNKN